MEMINDHPFSRTHACRVSDAIIYCGFRSVILENEHLRVIVLPEKGAEISALVYKPKDLDLLYKRGSLQKPHPYPTALVNSEDGFIKTYAGGWQELFPNGGSACRAGNAYLGTHGEVFLLPWRWQILEDSPQRVAVRFWVRTMQMPFFLERTMSLERDSASLKIEEAIRNESTEELPFMWGHHPAFGAPFLDGSCVLEAPAARVEVHEGEDGPNHRLAPGSCGEWPRMPGREGQEIDLSLIPTAESRTYDMFYLTQLNEGWFKLINHRLGLRVRLDWDVKVFPVLWVWQEFCGSSGYPWYSQTYALGLEPFTSYSTKAGSGLAEVMKAGGEARMVGGGQLSTEINLECSVE